MQRWLTIIGFVLAASFATSATAQASVRLGATDADFAAAGPGIACPVDPCALLQVSYPLGRHSIAPANGVIVRWQIRVSHLIGALPATTNLRVIGPAASPLAWGVSGPPLDVPDPAGLPATISQQVRIPISQGQGIAAQFQNLAGGNVFVAVRGVPGGSTGNVNSAPPAGSTGDPIVANGDRVLAIGADVEPDVDGDGFGDETQDGCPGSASAQAACPDITPPETTIGDGPKKKSTKRKAKFDLVSTEPGSTFRCELDGIETPCSSRFKKKVAPGKHHLEVAATDPSGNRDPTPATYDWKVKRPRR